MHRPTLTERQQVRSQLISKGRLDLSLSDNGDGTWSVRAGEVFFEAGSPEAVLREVGQAVGEVFRIAGGMS